MTDFFAPLAAPIAKEIEGIIASTPGWQGAQRSLQMAQLILDTKPDVVVEIGVYAGRSLVPMALALKHNGRGRVVGIDPWDVGEVWKSKAPEEDWSPSQEHLDSVYYSLCDRVFK